MDGISFRELNNSATYFSSFANVNSTNKHTVGEESVFYVAVGADGAPFGKDDTGTAYLVSFINLVSKSSKLQ